MGSYRWNILSGAPTKDYRRGQKDNHHGWAESHSIWAPPVQQLRERGRQRQERADGQSRYGKPQQSRRNGRNQQRRWWKPDGTESQGRQRSRPEAGQGHGQAEGGDIAEESPRSPQSQSGNCGKENPRKLNPWR